MDKHSFNKDLSSVTALRMEPDQPPRLSNASSAQALPLPELNGFRVIQELGRSPSGVVYKARRLVEQDVVAVKVFRDPSSRDAKKRDQLQANAEASFLLEHPALVRCLGCAISEGRLILIMEYVPGEPLARALQRNVRFLPPRALAITRRCAEALLYASQRRRFHGRLHPGDVILTENDIRILGVGLGEKPDHAPWQARDPHLFAPLVYVAPEAMPSRTRSDEPSAHCAADLYALGGLLYHMLTGSAPFHGKDEGAITQERASAGPGPVRWPRGTQSDLPPRSVALVERLLTFQPMERGSYEGLLAALDDAIQEVEGPPVLAAREIPMAPLPPAEINTGAPVAAPTAPSNNPVAGPAPILPVPAHDAAHAMPRAGGASTLGPTRAGPSYNYVRKSERSSTGLLVGAVVFVFGFTSGMAVKTFLSTPAPTDPAARPSDERAASGVEPNSEAAKQNVQEHHAPRIMSPMETRAASRLALAKDMLDAGEAPHSSSTLRVLRDILEEAGSGTATELKAQLLIAEVEEKIAAGGGRVAAAQPRTKQPTDEESQVFDTHLARARELAVENRFGAAIKHMQSLPEALRMAPFTDKAAQEIDRIETVAKTTFADIQLQAEGAFKNGDHAKARGLYQTVQARFDLKQWTDAAAERIKVIQEDENNALGAKAKLAEELNKQKALLALYNALVAAIPHAAGFQYEEAKADLDGFLKGATSEEARRLASEYRNLIRDEAWLFERCQKRLKEEMEVKGESPLVVKKKDDPKKPGLEIVAFDAKGLTYEVKQSGTSARNTREWSTISPTQPIVMLDLLMDKTNPLEHRAMAMLAFHRAARLTLEVKNPNRKNATPDELSGKARDFKDMYHTRLNDAVQAAEASRDAVQAQRTLLDKLFEMVSNPPAAAGDGAKD